MTKRRLVYAERYFRRLEDIRERIAEDNPAAAARVVLRIRAAVDRLKDDFVEIITVLHSAQRWPDRLP